MTNIQEEIWKQIPQFGRYEASNLGRIKSKCNKNEIILRPGYSGRGYLSVVIYRSDGRPKRSIAVHQLVAMAFLGYEMNGHKIVVDHIDQNKVNNRVDNLRLVTNRENMANKPRKSKYIGVNYVESRGKYRARIRDGSVIKWLGYHDSELDAHKAYQDALEKLKKDS